jgi:hypothetical protein
VADLIKKIDKNFNKDDECAILAATAFISDEVSKNASKAGISEVLHKPVKRELLFKCLKQYLFTKA